MAERIRRRTARRNDTAASAPPAAAKPVTLDNVLADLRDRIKANTPDASVAAGYTPTLGHFLDVVEHQARSARATDNEPLHFDGTVACDYRETMLAIAGAAIVAVTEHDRRALALPAGGAR